MKVRSASFSLLQAEPSTMRCGPNMFYPIWLLRPVRNGYCSTPGETRPGYSKAGALAVRRSNLSDDQHWEWSCNDRRTLAPWYIALLRTLVVPLELPCASGTDKDFQFNRIRAMGCSQIGSRG